MISRRPLTWKSGTVNSKTYDGDKSVIGIGTPQPDLVGIIGGNEVDGVLTPDILTFTPGGVTDLEFASENAGTHSITVKNGKWVISGTEADLDKYILPTNPVFAPGTITPKKITFGGTILAKKIYDGNDNFNDTHITISDAGSFQPGDIVPGDEGKVLLSASGASGKFGPASGTGVLSDVSGFTLIGEKAHNYTLSAQPSPVPAEILPLPEARDDRASVFACGSKTVNVLANDRHVAGGTLTIAADGKRGSATPSGTDITYDHNAADCATHGLKRDTVKYSICTANGCDTAKLVVDILRLPKIILMDSCSRRPYFMVNYQYPNAQYKWYRSPTGNDGEWTAMDSSLRLKVYVNEEAWYKVEITFDGETVMDKVHFIVHRKARVQANLYWYITSITR